MTLPLMPKATAVWLIEKTALTFTQIAEFCGMHPLEVQAIADGEVAQGIVGYDPVGNGQLTADEIRRAEQDPEARLRLRRPHCRAQAPTRLALYTSGQAERSSRCYCLSAAQLPPAREAHVAKLLGTTKDTIQKVRERTHWNSANIKPRDPVILGLCSQTDLNAAIVQANDRLEREGRAVPPPPVPEPDEAA